MPTLSSAFLATSLLLVSACGSTAVTSTAPTPAKCAVALTAPTTPVDAAGGIATVSLTTAPECGWTAEAGSSWVTRIEPSAGQGGASLQVALSSNPAPVARETDIVVNGVRARIQQQPATCQYDLSASTASVGSDGGSARVEVGTTAGCAWTASTVENWITITSGRSNTGTGVVEFTVEPNAQTARRTGDLVIAGRTFTVAQGALEPGCSYDVNPLAPTIAAVGGTIVVSIRTGCGWSAVSSAPWMSFGPAAGSGNGTVTLQVAPNTGPARSGSISIGSQTVTVEQAAAPACVPTVDPTTLSAPAGGATGLTVRVSAPVTCSWTASSATSWLTITTAATAVGNGTVALNVAANTGGPRTGSITVAGQSVTVSQAGNCTIGVNPSAAAVPAAGASGQTINVTAGNGCAWTTTSQAAWLSVTAGATGSGNGTVTFAAAANTGAGRSGTLTIGGQTVTVTQGGNCTIAVEPSTVSVAATATPNQSVSVTAGSGCAWTTTSQAPWLTIGAGASGSGNGTVVFNVAANNGGARTGTLTVSGQTITVSQAGNCTIAVNPSAVSVPAAATPNQSVNVTAGSGCAWTTTSQAPWLTISAGASGSGNGTVVFNVAANTGTARTGTVSVSGQTVTVTQAAACSYVVSPLSVSTGAAAGPVPAITVTAPVGCAWTAATSTPWLTIVSGAAGAGNGSVAVTAAANTGAPRAGSLSIAGATVTVNQSATCTYSANVTPLSFRDEGGTATGTVTTGAGCSWTVTSDSSWIVFSGGSTRTGSQTVTFTIQVNPNGRRNGTITMAGQTFAIFQDNK